MPLKNTSFSQEITVAIGALFFISSSERKKKVRLSSEEKLILNSLQPYFKGEIYV